MEKYRCATVPGLAHLAAVHAHEVGFLGVERRGEALAAGERLLHDVGKGFEIGFHAHASPPKTSTFVNTQAGDAWPTRITCDGSPLPQYGVPSTCCVSALPTRARLRQKFAEMPR